MKEIPQDLHTFVIYFLKVWTICISLMSCGSFHFQKVLINTADIIPIMIVFLWSPVFLMKELLLRTFI